MKKIIVIACLAGVTILVFGGLGYFRALLREREMLKEIITLLEADSRIAQVLVTNVAFDEQKNKTYTTIKFLEYDAAGRPLEPCYFTFAGNIIQFESLVIRFDDFFIKKKDPLRGRSAYLFWKVFMLNGANTQEYTITPLHEIPQGYKIKNADSSFEHKLWERFWRYALDSEAARLKGVKNAQIEAPGTLFVPGTLYTIKIEHDGGMRIDSERLPEILKGEYVPG